MKLVGSIAVVTLLLALHTRVLALGTETTGNAPMVKQPEWAEGVVDVVNLKSRVYSQWVNGNENFFYRGNVQALNEALRQFAAIKDDVRQLILLPGAGTTHSFDRKSIAFDWQLHVPSGIYKAVSKRTHAVMTVYVNAAKARPTERKRIEKWLHDLDSELFDIRAKATQELEKFGADAKPVLREALKSQPAAETRRRIENLLGKLRDFDVTELDVPKGITVISVDDLLAVHLKNMKDADSTVSGMAVQDLCSLAPYSDKVVPAVTEMLGKEKHEWVRRVAAGCLAHIGFEAKSAVPMLKKGLDDPDANIRSAFQTALEQIENAKDNPERAERIKKETAILKDINQFKKSAGGNN